MDWTAKIQDSPYPDAHPALKQLYGWYSAFHASTWPIDVCQWQKPDGSLVVVTNVCNNAKDPGEYYLWPDAVCLGPVTECIAPRSQSSLFF